MDFSQPGPFDRAGNLKFQDFLPFYAAAQMVKSGHAADLYDRKMQNDAMQAAIGQPVHASLPYLYGPQVAWILTPLSNLPFPSAAPAWAVINLFLFAACVYVVWRTCEHLAIFPGFVALIAVAYPPVFHLFVRGQNSAIVLACLTAAYLAFRAKLNLAAGFALGLLAFKPQFLIAIPLILLLSMSWRSLVGVLASSGLQLAFTRLYFGPATWHAYLDTLVHASRWLNAAEVTLAPLQMHSCVPFGVSWSLRPKFLLRSMRLLQSPRSPSLPQFGNLPRRSPSGLVG